jgi:hypothetical protein
MSLCGIKIARESVPLDDSDYDIQESIWYKVVSAPVKRYMKLLLKRKLVNFIVNYTAIWCTMTSVFYRQFVRQQLVAQPGARQLARVRLHMLHRNCRVLTCRVLISMSFAVSLAGAQNPAQWCRSGHFALLSESTEFSLARVTSPRSHFYGDETTADYAGCPTSDETACKLPSYVIENDVVVVNGKTHGEFSCVRYTASTDQSTTGWLKTVSLEPITATPPPGAWQGIWSTYDSTLVVSQSALDRGFIVEGEAYWYGVSTVHSGEVVARAEPFEAQLVLFGAYDCQLTLTLLQDYLVVQDNKRCGGMNVTFDGVYTRQ